MEGEPKSGFYYIETERKRIWLIGPRRVINGLSGFINQWWVDYGPDVGAAIFNDDDRFRSLWSVLVPYTNQPDRMTELRVASIMAAARVRS